jgi:hypothetical protein
MNDSVVLVNNYTVGGSVTRFAQSAWLMVQFHFPSGS